MTRKDCLARAEQLRRHRQLRNQVFAEFAEGFSDPAWDLLLTLFVAGEAGRPIETTLATATCSASTAERWLRWLVHSGLVVADGSGFVLSERGRGLIVEYFTAEDLEGGQ